MCSRRGLMRRPSHTNELHPFQLMLLKEVKDMEHECQAKRTAMLGYVQEYQRFRSGPGGKGKLLDDHMTVFTTCFGASREEAEKQCRQLFTPTAAGEALQGIRSGMCPSNFNYEKESMWHGTPSNPLIGKLARSIISSGFRSAGVIESRTLELQASEDMPDLVSFHLLLGDGSARATAACLVWTLLVKFVDQMPCDDPTIVNFVASLIDISVNFEVHGDGSRKHALIAQAALQNQAAAVQPCSTLQWIGMARDFTGHEIGEHVSTTMLLQKTLEEMVNSYNVRPEVQAYAQEAMPSRKKRRSKSGVPIAQDADQDSGLKIGRRRLMAMNNFLGGASEEAFVMLQRHVCVIGDYKYSVRTDEIMTQKSIYINSKMPKEWLPDEADLATREAVSESTLKLVPPGASRAEFAINPPLSKAQFHMVLQKVIHAYEAAVGELENDEGKIRHRPSEEGWLTARVVVQMWDLTICDVAQKDLGKSDFELFKKLVMETDQLDQELCTIRSRWSKWFHMGLLPQLLSDELPSADKTINALSVMQVEAELSSLKVFQFQLEADWALIEKTEKGKQALHELQLWRANDHRRRQAKIGDDLVTAWNNCHFPVCEVPSWDRVPSQVSLICRGFPSVAGYVRTVIILDFNAPGSRDTLRLSTMIEAAASCCKIMGPKDSVVLAWMPNCSKEGSMTTPFEDEVNIVNILRTRGFVNQERIRMLLDMPPSLANKVSAMDWFADGRLCWLQSNEENFWAGNSELARTKIVREIPVLPEPSDLLEVTSLDADEDLNTATRYMDVPEKCAQRGVKVSEVQMRALLTKTKRQTQCKWLGKDDRLVVLDFYAHVGDRAMATYEVQHSSDGSLGQMHHILVGVGTSQHCKFMKYTAQRIAHQAASDWLDGKLKLYATVHQSNGMQVEQQVKPESEVPEPTEDELRKIPGVLEAYQGIGKLELQICTVVGSKVIIRQDKLKQFDTASYEALAQLAILKGKHQKQYENAFRGKDKGKDTGEQDGNAPTGGDNESRIDNDPVPLMDDDDVTKDLVEFESLEALKAHAQISSECKSAIKAVTLLRDDQKQTVYAVAKNEDIVISKGTNVGGVGGGQILDSAADMIKVVPWSLPEGDKTWVQLTKKGDEDTEDKCKFVSGSLYSILRELESKSTKPLKVTSFGAVTAVTEGGVHKYNFASPEGAENHRKLDFVLTAGKPNSKITHANFFAPFVKEGSLGPGVLDTAWRLLHDPIGNCLKPQRVHVVTSRRIKLTQGKPVKILWPQSA